MQSIPSWLTLPIAPAPQQNLKRLHECNPSLACAVHACGTFEDRFYMIMEVRQYGTNTDCTTRTAPHIVPVVRHAVVPHRSPARLVDMPVPMHQWTCITSRRRRVLTSVNLLTSVKLLGNNVAEARRTNMSPHLPTAKALACGTQTPPPIYPPRNQLLQ